jgi:hypothetical protein
MRRRRKPASSHSRALVNATSPRAAGPQAARSGARPPRRAQRSTSRGTPPRAVPRSRRENHPGAELEQSERPRTPSCGERRSTLASLARGGRSPPGRSRSIGADADCRVGAIRRLLHAARPDWAKRTLARVRGDTAAHAIGNAFRAFARWSSRAASSFRATRPSSSRKRGRDLPARGASRDLRHRARRVVRSRARSARSPRIARLEETLARTAR